MKKIIFIFAVFFVQNNIISSDQELFLQGNSYFLDGKFEKARQSYEAMVSKDSAVLQNVGNCFFNEKNVVQALIYWKRAEKGARFNQLRQLFELEHKALEQMQCQPESFLMRHIKQVVLGVPYLVLQIILLILCLLFIGFFYRGTIQKKRMFILLLSMGSILLWMVMYKKWLSKKEAVVVEQKIAVYIGPETNFPQKTTLSLGNIVEIVEEQQKMVRVASSQGTGWVVRDMIEIV